MRKNCQPAAAYGAGVKRFIPWRCRLRSRLAAGLLWGALVHAPCQAQLPQAPPPPASTDAPDAPPTDTADTQEVKQTVEVQPLATDEQITGRLQRILSASDWFDNPAVRVEEGIVFLSGSTDSESRKKWAGDLARNTRDVVAVINHIKIKSPSLWDWTPALQSLRGLLDEFMRRLPLILFGIIVLTVAWFLGRGVTALLRRSFSHKDSLNRLLREVIARTAGFAVFLLGLYLVLLVVGLARLAVTVLGGTGLVGLIIGIAFRDITENFLASIFLSIQRPFRAGDLIEINDITGFVQHLTVRTTNLMSLDGNVVQIPNSIVYKSSLRNFSSNPNRREAFIIGIGYEDAVPRAQEIAMDVLTNHPAVLADPEPWVLVDNLGASTVNLKIYFWLDGSKHSWLKVRSSVIRLVKRAYQEQGISIPDAGREVYISREVPISLHLASASDEGRAQMVNALEAAEGHPSAPELHAAKPIVEHDTKAAAAQEPAAISTNAEGSLTSEAETAESQSKNVIPPSDEVDLLK